MRRNTNELKHLSFPDVLLDVPTRKQTTTFDCSLTALSMVLDYWEDFIPEHQLTKSLGQWVNRNERHIQGIASFLVHRGYMVVFKHHDPNVVDKSLDNLTEKDLPRIQNRLARLAEDADATPYRLKKLELDVEYIKAGGNFSNSIPTLLDIDLSLIAKVPVIICISQQVWQMNPGNKSNHYIVVVGKRGKNYIINDPSKVRQSRYEMNENILLMAWYKSGGYMLTAKLPKNQDEYDFEEQLAA